MPDTAYEVECSADVQAVAVESVADISRVSSDILDTDMLTQLYELEAGGATGLVQQMVDHYLSQSPQLLQTMQMAYQGHDLEALWRAAHSLKSSSATMGGGRLAELCRQIETQGRANELPTVELLQECQHHYQQLEEALLGYMRG